MSERPPAPIGDRPLGAIDILDGSFAALRQRPQTIVAIVALVVLPAALIEGYLVRGVATGTFDDVLDDPGRWTRTPGSPFGGFDATRLLMNAVVIAISGVPVARVVGGWLTGRDVSAVEALRHTLRRSWVIAAAFVMIHVLEIIGLFLLVFPAFLALLFFSLTSPVIALEQRGPWESMMRSMSLVRRDTSHVMGVVVILAVVSFGVDAAVGTLPTLVGFAIGPERTWISASFASALSSLILVPATAAAMALTYLDLRFRTEGLDIERRAERLFPIEGVVGDELAAPPWTHR